MTGASPCPTVPVRTDPAAIGAPLAAGVLLSLHAAKSERRATGMARTRGPMALRRPMPTADGWLALGAWSGSIATLFGSFTASSELLAGADLRCKENHVAKAPAVHLPQINAAQGRIGWLCARR